MSAIILSGGKSSRMGTGDKPFLSFGSGETLLTHIIKRIRLLFQEIILVTKDPENYQHIRVDRVVADIYEAGPLGGLHAGLYYATSPYSFVMACDMPFINLQLVEYMMEVVKGDILIPVIGGELEPLHAIYHKNCLPFIEDRIKGGYFKVLSFFHKVTVDLLPQDEVLQLDKDLLSFFNINTKEDYEQALQIWNDKL